MSFRVLRAEDAFWRPSNSTQVANTDLARQLGSSVSLNTWRRSRGSTSIADSGASVSVSSANRILPVPSSTT